MKLNLLLLSSLEASKLYFGRNGCEYGPSYWCENISKAHECGEGAKQFCIENRWNEPSAPDEVCETCKTAVGLVHMYLTDKKYVDNIISMSVQILSTFCFQNQKWRCRFARPCLQCCSRWTFENEMLWFGQTRNWCCLWLYWKSNRSKCHLPWYAGK